MYDEHSHVDNDSSTMFLRAVAIKLTKTKELKIILGKKLTVQLYVSRLKVQFGSVDFVRKNGKERKKEKETPRPPAPGKKQPHCLSLGWQVQVP